MAITKKLPLGLSDVWLGSTLPITVMLLRADVTDVDETVTDASDLTADEVATAGGYVAGGNGNITMPSLTRTQNTTSGVVEYDTGTFTWTSTSSFSVDSFRWLVVNTGSVPIAIYDLGADFALVSEPLVLNVAVSTYSPGVYPILRFRRNVT